jgi:serine O-acetyltransferase
MIKNNTYYYYYLEADRIALGLPLYKFSIKKYIINIFLPDYRWKYQRLMRKIEYHFNCKKGVINRIILFFLQVRYQKLGLKLLINIYPNTCGPGLSIAHHGPIRISKGTRIGANCRIHISTNIGIQAGTDSQSAIIGNNVYIGPGVKFVAACNIPSNTAIGANSVVTKSFNKKGTIIAGIPANVIKENSDTRKILIPATELLAKGIHNTEGMTSSQLFEKYFKE